MLGTEALTYRRLGVLIASLPRESLTVRAVQGESAEWGDIEHLLASIVDELRVFCYTYVTAHTKKGSHPTKPRFVNRPGVKSRPEKVKMTKAQMQEKLHRPRRDKGIDRKVGD